MLVDVPAVTRCIGPFSLTASDPETLEDPSLQRANA